MFGLKTQGKIPIMNQGGQSGVSNKPQQGDLRPPMNSTNPEQVRQGMGGASDIMQKSQNLGVVQQGGVSV
jgi:hypothetical protein